MKEVNSKFKDKRIAVFSNFDNEWHAGVFNYATEPFFEEHGTLVYFGRCPVYEAVLDSIFEYNSLLDLMKGKEKYLEKWSILQ